jgi:phosphatidylglycerol:prolipoprotein diacylglycerol transferase
VIPYVSEPTFSLGPITITAFGVLVCLAVMVGMEVVIRRAPRVGLSAELASSLVAWTIFWGFVGSRLFVVFVYEPGTWREDPFAVLRIWESMSSYGGMLGGLLGVWAVARLRGLSSGELLRFVDLVGYAFPFAWIFGRLGCSIRHDHMGIASEHFLAVDFPGGPRFDLGLLEFLYTLGIAAAFGLLGRRPRPAGFFLALFLTVYGPARFGMEFLRVGELRYLGWTPAQYLALTLTAVGIVGLAILFRRRGGERPA